MRIIYFSKTGNIKRFVSKINIDCTNGNNIKNINEDFILITYTFKFGEIPDDVDIFLKENKKNLCGVVGSGNKNWGIFYNKAAKDISKNFNVPLLYEFELAGNIHDVQEFKKIFEVFKKGPK